MAEAEPIRLLHVFPSFGLGGQQARLSALVRGFADQFSHQIVSLDPDMSAGEAFMPGMRIEYAPTLKSRGISPTTLKRLRALIEGAKPHVLCTYNFGSLEAAAANIWGPRFPHVHHEDGFGPDENEARQKLRRILFRRLILGSSDVIVPSISLESCAKSIWRLPARRVQRIPNGIDVARFAAPARLRDDVVRIGAVGALRPEKNFSRLLHAFARLPDESARLVIIGDGPEGEALRSQTETLGVARRVRFAGRMADTSPAYARFDIFALSSDTEQMPLTIMEAMASGLPIVATDVGDVRSMVAPLNAPFIVSPDDLDGFADSLAALIADPSLRAGLGEANRKAAEAQFSLDGMIFAYGRAYASAARRRRRA